MTIATLLVFSAIGIVAYFAMLSDELDPVGALPLIAVCIMAGIIAHRTTWWLGIASFAGVIVILLLAVLLWTILEPYYYQWHFWALQRRIKRQRRKSEKNASCP